MIARVWGEEARHDVAVKESQNVFGYCICAGPAMCCRIAWKIGDCIQQCVNPYSSLDLRPLLQHRAIGDKTKPRQLQHHRRNAAVCLARSPPSQNVSGGTAVVEMLLTALGRRNSRHCRSALILAAAADHKRYIVLHNCPIDCWYLSKWQPR